MAIFLEHLLKPDATVERNNYPFNLDFLKSFHEIRFVEPITFFVGENGSGKSTLLELIAAGAGLPTVGSSEMELDDSISAAIENSQVFQFSWKKKTHRGFFLRAEDFLGYAKKLTREIMALENEAEDVRQKIHGSGQSLALGAILSQRDALISRYGRNLDANSHGESFLKFFNSRLVPGGLYLLDEPETPLSPRNILSLAAMVKEMVRQDCQFIIATHSPMLMALQPAKILYFENDSITETDYRETDHVQLMKSFLDNPEKFLRYL